MSVADTVARNRRAGAGTRPVALVWIDARQAIIVRGRDGADVERLSSDVPPHQRSTDHVRHDPAIRHGGGLPQDAIERDRLEHLARFVDLVAGRLADDEDVVILGPGVVREQLERHLRDEDRRRHRTRTVRSEPSRRLTDRQLVARQRLLSGHAPPRGMAGRVRAARRGPAGPP